MSEIAKLYQDNNINGWLGKNNPELVEEQFNLIKDSFLDFSIRSKTRDSKGKKMMLYDVTRKVLGKDTDNYPQEIGDCVSFGAKNAVEYLMAAERVMKGDREKWAPVFPPYLYGTGRVLIGRGQFDGDDGSLGSWMADAVIKYGVLRADFDGVPKYSGKVAKKWGDTPGPDKKFVDEGKTHPVKSAALIRNWDDLVDAVVNGYPCTTASDIGYNMEPSSDGFHRQTDSWGHQMCIIGVDDGYKNGSDPYAIILNSWGDCHGRLKDFDTNDNLPVGVLRVRRKDIEKHIRQQETFAYSNFDGFPEQLIDKALFMLV
jgi:hypothetical protein